MSSRPNTTNISRFRGMSCAASKEDGGPNFCTLSQHPPISIPTLHSFRRTTLMAEHKHQKLHKVQKADYTEDKISNLPDCILHHILSFLPTKDAVGTCILSTRWKYLWTSVPNIDFDDELLYSSGLDGWPLEAGCFMNFVERVLLLRDSSTMKKFRLSCRVCFSAARVHAWVSAAIMHNVQELDLCLFVDNSFILPRCMFDTKSLTVLKIQLTCVLELPTCISFPCLKTLHLRLVTFPDDISTQKLFSGCPVLQELAIIDCDWMYLNSITISIPTLTSLTIDDLPYFGANDDLHGCDINVDAINLLHLKYLGHLSNELFLHNISSLAKACVHIPIRLERQKEIAYRAVKLLGALRNISSIRITNRTIESLSFGDKVRVSFPLFKNLTHLELSMGIENHTVWPLMKLIQCSPNLKSLDFVEGLDLGMNLGEDYWTYISVPECLLCSLKEVSFHRFCGYDAEICFLKYFLKNSLVLERMNIYSSKNLLGDPNKQIEVRNQLQVFARGSAGCEIGFF
ncbi:hypothetical protein LguiB_003056 [Lonicera macranthoides]